ncbi:MAG TPA: tripartite tricarboxylate transporter substrate binding protein [Advenella sp.]|nr:tripartite tricarboxylate transporter substrate binding protein [Advenella sp.]
MKTRINAILRLMAISASVISTVLIPTSVLAQNPVRVMVGFPPGGATDVMARALAHELSKRMDREFVVENRPGASGNIAASAVARATPNGESLLFVASTHATNPSLYSNLSFDAKDDFATIGMVATSPYVLVVNPKVPVKSVDELTAYLKQHPGKINFASASAGTGQHLAGEVYKKAAGVNILHVPYKGSSAALSDLIAGRVEMMFDNVAVMMPHIKSGALRPLAVTSEQRFKEFADLPTMAEAGYAGFNVVSWFALLAPAKTPVQFLDELNLKVNDVLKSESFIKQLAEFGATPKPSTPEQSNAFIDAEIARWHKVIDDLGLKIN